MKKFGWMEGIGFLIGSVMGLCILGMYVIAPFALIKALNVLFHLGVPYNSETYCLSAILILIFGNPNFSFSDRRK